MREHAELELQKASPLGRLQKLTLPLHQPSSPSGRLCVLPSARPSSEHWGERRAGLMRTDASLAACQFVRVRVLGPMILLELANKTIADAISEQLDAECACPPWLRVAVPDSRQEGRHPRVQVQRL